MTLCSPFSPSHEFVGAVNCEHFVLGTLPAWAVGVTGSFEVRAVYFWQVCNRNETKDRG